MLSKDGDSQESFIDMDISGFNESLKKTKVPDDVAKEVDEILLMKHH